MTWIVIYDDVEAVFCDQRDWAIGSLASLMGPRCLTVTSGGDAMSSCAGMQMGQNHHDYKHPCKLGSHVALRGPFSVQLFWEVSPSVNCGGDAAIQITVVSKP